MSHRIALIVIATIVLAHGHISLAQMDVDEAQARLEARAAERARATTQPTTIESEPLHKEVLALRRQVIALESQIAALQADNSQLRNQLGQVAGLVKKANFTFESRAKTMLGASGQAWSESGQASIAEAHRLDMQIAACLKTHSEVSDDMASDAFAGEITVGMPWDVAKLLASPKLIATLDESANSTIYQVLPRIAGNSYDPSGPWRILTVKNGQITSVEHRVHSLGVPNAVIPGDN